MICLLLTPRVRLVANEALGLDYLFDHYVNHSFLTNESAPNRMYERAYSWVGRVKRLKQTQQMSESTAVLFAYEKPQSMTDPQIEAFQMLNPHHNMIQHTVLVQQL